MKKALTVIVVALLVVGIASILVLAGCGGEKTITTEEGTITEKDGEITYEGDEGETTVSTEDISEEDIGVPIYPGAKLGQDEAGTVTTESAEGEVKWSAAVLYTNDDVDKVMSWYKDELSGMDKFVDSSYSMEGSQMGMYTFEEGGEVKSVMVSDAETGDPGKTMILIQSGSGAGMEMPDVEVPEMPEMP